MHSIQKPNTFCRNTAGSIFYLIPRIPAFQDIIIRIRGKIVTIRKDGVLVHRSTNNTKTFADEGNATHISFSERELDIIQCISIGLSDQAIANKLLLSLNTIKWYNRKIFAKLSVNNRTQAVARSYKLHIIDREM